MRIACLLLCVGAAGTVGAQSTLGTPHFWPAPSAPGTQGPTPEELAGFHFGWSEGRVAQTCRRAGHRFERRGVVASCSGGAGPGSRAVRVGFVFCEGRLCEARATVHDGSRVRTYAHALRALRGAFGPPPQRRLRVDHRCLGELLAGRSDRCLGERGSGVRHWWEVSGTEIFLSLERREEGPVLEIAYRNRQRLTALSRTSD